MTSIKMPVKCRFGNFNKKTIKILKKYVKRVGNPNSFSYLYA